MCITLKLSLLGVMKVYVYCSILPYYHFHNLLAQARDGATRDHTSSDSTVCAVISHDITAHDKNSKTAISREDKNEVVGVARRNHKRPPLVAGPVSVPCVVTPLTPLPGESPPDLDISIHSGTDCPDH